MQILGSIASSRRVAVEAPATFDLLASTTTGSPTAGSITFSNINQSYTDLLVRFSGRTTHPNANIHNIRFTFNYADSFTPGWLFYRDGTTVSNGPIGPTIWPQGAYGFTANISSEYFMCHELYIPNYSIQHTKNYSYNWSGDTNGIAYSMFSGVVNMVQTGAVTSLTITASPDVGAVLGDNVTAQIYGIKYTQPTS